MKTGRAKPVGYKAHKKVSAAAADKQKVAIPGAGFSATLAAGLVVALVVIVLAFQNTENAVVEFLTWDRSMPLVVIILGAALAGVVLDEVGGFFWRHHRRQQIAQKLELDALRSAGSNVAGVDVPDLDVTGNVGPLTEHPTISGDNSPHPTAAT